jgi:hypothetical protein
MRIVWTAENQGGGSAEIDLREDQMDDVWAPGYHRIVIRGDRHFGGDLTRLERTGGPGDDFVGWKASAVGLIHRLDYRIVRFDFTVNDTADVIVEALLNEAQENQFNGDMGFHMGTTEGAFISRQRAYCPGAVISDAIRELAGIGRGFDWEIAPHGRLNMWSHSRGNDTGITLTEGMCENFEIQMDTSDLITNITVLADPTDPFGPIKRMSRTAKADNYGRRETAVDSDIIVDTDENPDWEDEMYDFGHGILKTDGGGELRVKATWNSKNAPWTLHDVWLQDRVDVVLPTWFGGTQNMRVTDVTVTIEAMPPRASAPPIYWIEYGFDKLVRDIEVTDGDPDGDEEV